MAITNRERAILQSAIARIRNKAGGVTPEIRAALDVARLYLETYVATPLEIIAEDHGKQSRMGRACDLRTAESLASIHPAHKESSK